jgi:hypothetical protein
MGDLVRKGKDQRASKWWWEAETPLALMGEVVSTQSKLAAGEKLCIWCSLPYGPQTRLLESIGIRK